MGMRINYNGAAANAWRNLGANDAKLAGSVEKLSSGLRINKGADDPAGLIISERLKSQITGLGQAVKNAQEATSLVQTAEGALTEMNSMLNKMRALAVHSANAGVNDADSIAADQSQLDSALDSMQKIAENTKYQQKVLLNGEAANTASYTNTEDYAAIDVEGDTTGIVGSLDITVSTAATLATVSGVDGTFNANKLTNVAFTLTLESSDYNAVEVSFTSGASLNSIVAAVNNYENETGITASTNAGELAFEFESYGDDHNITVKSSAANVISSDTDTAIYAEGGDIAGEIVVNVDGSDQTLNVTGDGLKMTVNSTESTLAGTEVTVTTTGNDTTAGTNTDAFSVEVGALEFSLGQDASANEIRSLTIANMQTSELGKGVSGLDATASLESLRSDGAYDLDSDAANAVKIIDQAIDDVSIARADLGAFQQNALETTISTLSINKENLEASNSRIADVDMAQEMMSFTKSQILTQAGTAMLAQANQLPQSVLQLLG